MTAEGENAEVSFLFADLAGFTALTEAHGDQTRAEIAQRFTAAVQRLLPQDGARVVKTIGDEVMVQVESAQEAVRLGRRVVDELARHLSPPVRVGIHSGPAVVVGGDFFGASVNLASRVSGAARAGEVLITEATRSRLSADEQSALTARGRRYFKGVGDPVAVYSAARAGASGHELVIDPVCRMAVDPARSGERQHGGREYRFCSDHCARAFAAEPGRYIAHSRRARAARAAFARHLRVFILVQLGLLALWAAGLALGGPTFPWFALILVGWSIPLRFHYRAVRHLL